MASEFLGFSLDIGATLVGIITIVIIGRQMRDQRKLNQRIADMQYAKLMEDKLLAIVYSGKYNAGHKETIHSAPSMEWYKFHFMQGFIVENKGPDREMVSIFGIDDGQNVHRNGYTFNQIYFKEPLRGDYLNTYNSMIQNIKTEDIQEYYKNSNFGKLAKMIDAATKN
jgi:hypothetical protein